MTADWPVSPTALRKLLGEIGESSRSEPVLALGGEPELVAALQRELLRGGTDRAAVRVGDPDAAAVYVRILAGEPAETDVAILRRARRARVPALAVLTGEFGADTSVPYVLATDIVRVPGGQDVPLEALLRPIARRLGEEGAQLAARVPQLRPAVCERLIASATRKNGLLSATGGTSGADLPVLTLNELRLVLRLAQAYGAADVRERVPELAATVGAALGLRSIARKLLEVAPVAAWAVEGAVAYAGTKVLGEAALRRFVAATRRPVAAGPAGR